MSRQTNRVEGRFAWVLAGLLMAAQALAQNSPDAGRLQRESEELRRLPAKPPKPSPSMKAPATPKPPLQEAGVARMHVRAFRLSGNLAIPAEALQARLHPWAGRDLSMGDLMQAVQALTDLYRDRGYLLARAYLPAQEVSEDVIEIAILEGRLDRIQVVPQGEVRMREQVLIDTLQSALPAQGALRVEDLDWGLRLLNDLPGLDVRSLLTPGQEVGTTSIQLEVEEGPLLSGLAGLDNQGGRYTGSVTGYVSLDANDPGGRGDQLSARLAHSSGLSYSRVGYQLPLGRTGLTGQLAYAATRYRLCCDFSALDARGKGDSTTLGLVRALYRASQAHLSGALQFHVRRFENRASGEVTSDKRLHSLALSLEGWQFSGALREMQTRFQVGLTAGRANLDGWSPDRTADAATARVHGSYAKLEAQLSHLRPLGPVDLHAAFSGQLASRNLDSAEKFSLGGARGIRAYPLGEATGDEGWLLNLELRRPLGPEWRLSGFLDHGYIRQHKRPWNGWQGGADTPLDYHLSGYGLALARQTSGGQLRAAVAQRLGSNPGRDAAGNDADGRSPPVRFWLEMQAAF